MVKIFKILNKSHLSQNLSSFQQKIFEKKIIRLSLTKFQEFEKKNEKWQKKSCFY